MMKVVRPSASFLSASVTSRSFSLSRPVVGSSRIRMGLFRTAARAILAYAPAMEIVGPWQRRVRRLQNTLNALERAGGSFGDEERNAAQSSDSLTVLLTCHLADALWAIGEIENAREHAENACDLAERLEDGLAKAKAFRIRGRISFAGHKAGRIPPDRPANLSRGWTGEAHCASVPRPLDSNLRFSSTTSSCPAPSLRESANPAVPQDRL